jgi:hypothetical protein
MLLISCHKSGTGHVKQKPLTYILSWVLVYEIGECSFDPLYMNNGMRQQMTMDLIIVSERVLTRNSIFS